MQHTTNYNLNQWEADDRVTRADFNDDNAKIDAALGSCARVMAGTYDGNNNTSRTINLGVKPKVVMIWMDGTTQDRNGNTYGGVASTAFNTGPIQIVSNGFTVINSGSYALNSSGSRYVYIVLY